MKKTAEYAGQSDYGDNPKDFTADYYHAIGGLMAPNKGSLLTKISGKIGYEVYGSDNGVSFQTPLGANHRCNGWADLFGKTKPADGLRDLYGALSGTFAGFKVDLRYHDFEADEGGSDYGTEFDTMLAQATWNREKLTDSLRRTQRVIEWAHAATLLAFGEVWPSWTYLIPDITRICDDIVRSSPMLLYGMGFSQLEDVVSGQERISHLLIDKEFTEGVRALNPIAVKLRVNILKLYKENGATKPGQTLPRSPAS